jgi:alpha-tubulin suppressor-like RCC1 family protein
MFNRMKKVLLLTVPVVMAATLLLCGCSEGIVGEESADDISESDMGSDLTSEDGTFAGIQEDNLEDKLFIHQDASPGIYDTVSTDGGAYFVIKNDNTLWAWGDNFNGQLGIGTVTDLKGPQQTEPVIVMEDVKTVSTGGSGGNNHTLIVKTDGTLWVCGSNSSGQLGTGAIEDGVHPTPEYIMDDVIFVCSDSSSFAIKSDNSLWAWGLNFFGELGTGSTEPQYSPIKIMDDVSYVNSSGSDTFVIKTDGSLWAWGLNHSGTLGIGSEDKNLVPTKVMDDVAYVCGGYMISCAIKTDGSLWAWGSYWGEDGNHNPAYEPIHIADDVVAASLEDCNSDYVFFLKSDGTLWRENTYFQFSYYTNDGKWVFWDGEEEPQNQVTDIATIVSGRSGRVHMMVKSDGTVFGQENFQIFDDAKLN